ncbi:hypothetical protein [Halorussus salinisoli]|uniref:hypothetical protein n=1 Tax=Halorussus salinisoli TaxID=2558242 RepID=UPI0010C22F12|nr:hypothetical protein [Halorussus salinisoli]
MERRNFLALLGGGLLSLSLLGDSTDYTDSGTALRNLATRVDDADIADPHQTPRLIHDIENALAKSKTGLNSDATDRARKIADIKHSIANLLSVLPGVSPPAKPPIENEIREIRAAHTYYETLLAYLRTSSDLREELMAIDFEVREERNGLPASRNHESKFSEVDSALETLQNETERGSDTSAMHRSQLLPNRENVRRDATQLRDVYATYSAVQNGYIRASRLVDEATIHRENREREKAMDTFAEALSVMESNVPENLRGYSLSATALSLDGYHRMLRAYHEGIPLLKRSCNAETETTKAPNRLFGDGFAHLLRARRVLESG